MIKLFVRNYLLFVLVITVIVLLLLFLNHVQQKAENATAEMIASAPMRFLQAKFRQMPEDKWQPYVSQLQSDTNTQKIYIVTKNRLPEALRNSQALEKGNIVGSLPGFALTRAKPYMSSIAWQRIGKTDQYFKLILIPPTIKQYQENTAWLKIILDQLFAEGKNIETAKKQAEAIFGREIHVIPFSTLTPDEKRHFEKWGLNAETFDDNHIATLRYLSPDGKQVIDLGNFSDRFVVRYINTILIVVILLILLVVVFIWSYPFYRGLGKLEKQAIDYGNGRFDTRLKMSKALALQPLNTALHKMADQLQTLIASHRELTNAIAHEIKTPLARVRFTLGILKQKYQRIDPRYIDDLDEDIEVLDTLVNEILLHARFDRKGVLLNKEIVNLNQLIEAKVAWFAKKYPDKIWSQKTGDCDIVCPVDLTSFNRVLDNLLNNAFQYGGERIMVGLKQEKDETVIRVEDSGQALEIADREKIFTAFERLSASRNKAVKGHGLGLAISRKIIEAHGGTIDMEKTDKKHTVFVIKLPRCLKDND